jgi:hypothetical protein
VWHVIDGTSARFLTHLGSGPKKTEGIMAAEKLIDLRIIWEVLFQDGVTVANKDEKPWYLFPELQGVSHLKGLCFMTSLKPRA